MFLRVTSTSLDPQKNWYILTKVCGMQPTDFAKSEIFKTFPDVIQNVSAQELLPANHRTTQS